MKENLFLPAVIVLAIASALLADEPPMTKIVVRASGPEIPPESHSAKPRTLYLAGPKYGRVEEELDREHGLHVRFITNEPDNWIVNLVNKTVQHIVDRGPTFIFRAPVFWVPKPEGQPDPDKEFKDLEFGNEFQFFHDQGSQDLGQRQFEGKKCSVLSLKKGSTEVTLFVDLATRLPYQINVTIEGKPQVSYRYLEYKTNLPFQKSLFEPPKGVKITEAK
jgi:hypothetical protein